MNDDLITALEYANNTWDYNPFAWREWGIGEFRIPFHLTCEWDFNDKYNEDWTLEIEPDPVPEYDAGYDPDEDDEDEDF